MAKDDLNLICSVVICLVEREMGKVGKSRIEIHRRDLKRSENTIGQLYPVLRDAKGRVIDGYHRLDANPDWKSVTLEDVKTEEERLIVSAHVNIGRREVSKAEKIKIVNDLADIYYQQGLRPDAKANRLRKDNSTMYITVNEIKQKIFEVLNGIMTKSQIKNYLYPKYLNQKVSENKKKYYKDSIKNTSAWTLLLNSHGVQLKKTYGIDFFDRLKREMLKKSLIKAKQLLRFDRAFIEKVKAEIREEVETELDMMVVA